MNFDILKVGALRGKKVENPVDSANQTVIPEAKPQNKLETKSEIKLETKPENKLETKPEIKLETKPENKLEIKPEIKEEPKKIPKPRKIVKICKVGVDHASHNVNNQDFVFSFMNIKVVSDGCGSGKHSEIGSQLFGQLFSREVARFIDCVNKKNTVKMLKYVKSRNIKELAEHLDKGEIPEEAFLGIVNEVFEQMLSICSETTFVFENYCFTILACLEYEDEFVVFSCGDGFIIKENFDGITFDKLDDGEYPAYYVYNWIDSDRLIDYKEGVEFKVSRYSKADYINVGVASDGLRFFEDLYEPEKYNFYDNLSAGKGPQIEMLITKNNRNGSTFKDDISICF